MADADAQSHVRALAVARHPLYALFLPVPIVCFVGAVAMIAAYLFWQLTDQWGLPAWPSALLPGCSS